MKKQFARAVAGGVLVFWAAITNATVVYFSDDQGRVGSYDDVTDNVSAVGDVSASFTVGQVIGIAWDAANNRILVLDRNGSGAVYAMNPTTGATTLLFTPGISFQGGAVVGSLLYGIDEDTQTVEAFDLGTFANQNLSASALSRHSHAMGVDSSNGQLYLGGGDDIYTATAAGAEGAVVVSPGGSEDLDYYNGDFLMVDYSVNVLRVNGTTGVVTEFLSAAQVSAGGLSSSVSGVAVGTPAQAPAPTHAPTSIPTLSEWGMIILSSLLALGTILTLRRQRQ